MNIGKAIKLCRTQKNFTQASLAKKAGIATSYLSQIEKNRRIPNLQVVEKIAIALHIPLSILIFLSAEPSELKKINNELAEKISKLALDLMHEKS